ncbi:unnamed protein product [Strongylus vulgaris]|uniref:Uncharacterized protein n=1 Tax=Strongylus vulgaris TaxID=40348 RepID=A0A3P7I2R6_STRVU|nr:unnamed protein product [Strongylus vulgaris]
MSSRYGKQIWDAFLIELLMVYFSWRIATATLHPSLIWTRPKTVLSMVAIWAIILSTSLPYVYSTAISLSFGSDGVILLSAGVMITYATGQTAVVNLLAMIACSTCYAACFAKIRDPQHRYKDVDKRLFFCALMSSLPFCAEVVRSIVSLATFERRGSLHEFSLDFRIPILELVHVILDFPRVVEAIILVYVEHVVAVIMKRK